MPFKNTEFQESLQLVSIDRMLDLDRFLFQIRTKIIQAILSHASVMTCLAPLTTTFLHIIPAVSCLRKETKGMGMVNGTASGVKKRVAAFP